MAYLNQLRASRATRLKRLAVSILAIVLCLASASAVRADDIDDFVRRELQRQHIPGASLAILKEGRVIKAEGYGLADVKNRMPSTANTVYHIGSIAKQFIASSIMLLEQDGKLRVGDQITQYFPDAPPAWRGITIQHLLTHTSGLDRQAPGYDRRIVQVDAEVIRTAYAVPLRFVPGDKWEYSNLGYEVLGEIIRIAAVRPWSDYVSTRIFGPVGMSETRLNTLEPVRNRAVGYTDNDLIKEAVLDGHIQPGGPFLSTVLDMAKWDAALRAGDIVSPAILKRMWTPVTLNGGTVYPYGYGWELEGQRDGPLRVRHGGGINGYLSQFVRYVDEGISVIILANMDDADLASIVRGVLDRAQAPAPEAVAPR